MEILVNDDLKSWLCSEIGTLAPPNMELLVEYICAMLADTLDMAQLREKCLAQLKDFLGNDTEPFVSSLFNYLETASRLTGLSDSDEIPGLTTQEESANQAKGLCESNAEQRLAGSDTEEGFGAEISQHRDSLDHNDWAAYESLDEYDYGQANDNTSRERSLETGGSYDDRQDYYAGQGNAGLSLDEESHGTGTDAESHKGENSWREKSPQTPPVDEMIFKRPKVDTGGIASPTEGSLLSGHTVTEPANSVVVSVIGGDIQLDEATPDAEDLAWDEMGMGTGGTAAQFLWHPLKSSGTEFGRPDSWYGAESMRLGGTFSGTGGRPMFDPPQRGMLGNSMDNSYDYGREMNFQDGMGGRMAYASNITVVPVMPGDFESEQRRGRPGYRQRQGESHGHWMRDRIAPKMDGGVIRTNSTQARQAANRGGVIGKLAADENYPQVRNPVEVAPSDVMLEIKCVPSQLNNEMTIRQYFARYGAVKVVTARFNGRADAARITFASSLEAKRAYEDQAPVLGSVQVKMFFVRKGRRNRPNQSNAGRRPFARAQGAQSSSQSVARPKQSAPVVTTQMSVETVSNGSTAVQAQNLDEVKPPPAPLPDDKTKGGQKTREALIAEQKELIERLEKSKSTITPSERQQIMKQFKELSLQISACPKPVPTSRVTANNIKNQLRAKQLALQQQREKISGGTGGKIYVSGVHEDEIDGLRTHFLSYGQLAASDAIVVHKKGVVVTFTNREAANKALEHGTQYSGRQLQMVWFVPVESPSS